VGERRRIEAHPRTGVIQIVEVRERVEVIAPAPPLLRPIFGTPVEVSRPVAPPLFEALSTDDLLTIGVPQDWIVDISQASEDRFLEIAGHLPAEAAEALLEYAATGVFHRPAAVAEADPFAHPDSLRRFRVVENVEELQRALDYPWEKWTAFLHPCSEASLRNPSPVRHASRGRQAPARPSSRSIAQPPSSNAIRKPVCF
jgi:hypothetical protein